MALGTMTLVSQHKGDGPIFYDRVTLVGDGSYPTGGSTGVEAKLRALTKDQRTIIKIDEEDYGGDRAVYDRVNEKLKVYDKDTGAEKANASNQAGVTYKFCIVSR